MAAVVTVAFVVVFVDVLELATVPTEGTVDVVSTEGELLVFVVAVASGVAVAAVVASGVAVAAVVGSGVAEAVVVGVGVGVAVEVEVGVTVGLVVGDETA